ncbi:MFS transporter [Motiliproteus coralliicola]|uniref:MFS transporter n=1 Tax=Motiliproteus coralliicola TaxID=2283196 RepID=UPI001FB55A75|nr:MFS transporter [Motiliproteus coralliicola]
MLSASALSSFFINRSVALLALCQALLTTGNVLLVSVLALIGNQLADQPALATLPVAIQFLGTMLAAYPASLLMKRIGRRAGFWIGNGLGIVGALVAFWALGRESLLLFCFGSALIGACIGISQLYRFAAVDVSDEAHKHRAISLVMAGGLVAALVGPALAIWSRDWLPDLLYGGNYLALVLIYLLAITALGWVRVPPSSDEEVHGQARPIAEVVRQPVFIVAVLGAVVAYAVMVLIMNATPLSMQACGFSFGITAGVIQWHVLGMFAPSFITGRLISRFGVTTIMLVGSVLMIGCILVNLQGIGRWHFTSALILLGVGWNFLFIGSTSLLTEAYRPAEKARAQGINEMLVSMSVMVASFCSGLLQNLWGWDWVNLAMAPPLLLVVVAIVWLSRIKSAEQPA